MAAPFLGILSLDTAFERIVGDIGNPESYPFPALVHIVTGADSHMIVQDNPPPPDLLQGFIDGAQRLERAGARAIVSTCGFLITSQAEIAQAVNVPVLLSALSLFPMVQVACSGRIGIITASQASLGPNALAAAGTDAGAVEIAGLDHIPEFAETFLAKKSLQRTTLDPVLIAAKVVAVAEDMVRHNPEIAAVILECGNLPPYADAIQSAVKRPMFHLGDAAAHLMAANVGV
ncbi:hypothetical protein KMP13_13985 [Epibacterium ulvae]|uniref:aspartate/glutamate racemase family protein n=1 Tax=Epibacterium ulvae TaxID=1156985 RepID=UPI001BFC22A6|nr:aspartate/glutamate racemase family protein [Epibacterium ulvae]MBT8154972.1 hypothetical protein [Epibacterium ulvae]